MNLAPADQAPIRYHPLPPLSLPLPLPDDRSGLQAYIEQSRAALQSQRASFECERAAFGEERKLWSQEREILKSRIANLEKHINCTHEDMATAVPVNQAGNPSSASLRVWEGSRPTGRPTRRFFDGTSAAGLLAPAPAPAAYDSSFLQVDDHLASGRSPSLDEALSPRSQPVDRAHHVAIPVELVDSSLDGITLKSTGLPPNVAAKLTSPPLATSNIPSPPQLGTALTAAAAADANESRDHYHTHDGCDASTLQTAPPEVGTTAEPTVQAPAERPRLTTHTTDEQPKFTPDADSPDHNYTEVEIDDDPELTGPLMLRNDEEQDLDFLEALDKKLLMEAKRVVSASPTLSDIDALSDVANPQSEPEPEIRFKKTTNFGTAFGSTQRMA
ncbi:hypothetical protein MGYG_03757 [Nannizzia gypsea CBS 118893]|uniref:Uncharacterized protein n=1 Tax=Arthroderma gypseum (strain ATCC MYA-4604 / CBS 118893) TaxID=535722 RepID=E4UTP4_ARTGP|nr:hypothetical protein MGYG_03757 [Nannizzia gypsea CBS 118893]EFR00753.1 hypothetical protein MGYG_03757 [Nannizzia gypsea CBS 118893]